MTRIRLLAYVILDGTLIPVDRVHDQTPYVATLKTWKILTKLRCSPSRTTAMVQAILVLHHVENPTYQGGKTLGHADRP